MFAIATKDSYAQRVVATLVACALVMASIGYYTTAQAANLTNVSNTLTDSNPTVTSGHTIAFTIPTGSSYGIGEDITIDLSAFSDVGTVVQGDLTVTVNAGSASIQTFDNTNDILTFDLDTAASAGQEIVVAIDDGKITNPAAGSYEIEVTTATDTGKTRVAIIDNVEVTAIVNTSFEFNIAGVATGTATQIAGDDTTGSTTATLMAFGQLTAGSPEVLAQDLSVETNARNGFSVTVESDGDLMSSNGAIIDSFLDGTDVSTAGTAWASPSNDINDRTTWGHWGLTSSDSDLSDEMITTDSYIAASTTAREIFSHDGPADGVTTDIGTSTVAYKLEITALQEAADDYTTTLTYIATPTF